MAQPDIYSRTMIDVLTPNVKSAVLKQFIADTFTGAGCTHEDGYENEYLEHYPMERYSVFKTSTELGTYNHHQLITKWKGKYWCVWDNCLVHEEMPGQSTYIAWSDDGEVWSPRHLVVAGDEKGGVLYNIGSLVPTKDRLYAIIQRKWNVSRALMQGMSTVDNRRCTYRLDLWSTTNGTDWRIYKEGFIDAMWVFENPRLTNEGRLLCSIATHDMHPGVALWPGADPEAAPELIAMPYAGNTDDYFTGHDEGLFVAGEASWYTDDDGRIWMWHRDESASCYLAVALSQDGGKTWTEVMRSNFPDCMSRVHAGRLTDGRFYLVGNATRCFMNRNFFALALSDDGAKFNRLIRLIEKPTTQRFRGHLKVHGYQYPSCHVEENRLMIVYSVNKEDIEIGFVDTRKI
jgi:hypothetical protein